MAGKSYFQGMTKTQLTAAIRTEISARRFGEVFESKMISDLILEHHYFCSVQGLRPEAFKKIDRGSYGYDFYGRFGDRWHLVSWVQCINKRDDLDWIVRALRDAAQPIVFAYRKQHPLCEVCGVAQSEEVDHVQPQFSQIAELALRTLSPDDITKALQRCDWWSDEPFSLLPDSPAYEVLKEEHKTAILQAVCKPCHLKNAASRR